jgi:tetratricopeptide (TPR) repeat protein
MGRSPKRMCGALLVLGVLVFSARASAQGMIDMGGMPDQEAKSHFKVGKSLYESGRFSEAAEEFEKAYQLSNKVELLYNVYVAHRDATDLPRAIDALRRYLQLAELDEPSRLNLQARLRAMEEAGERGAAPHPAEAPPADPEPPASEPPAPEEEPRTELHSPGTAEMTIDANSSVLPYALIGVGGAALLAGVVTAVMASDKIAEIEDACVNDVCPPADSFDLESRRSDASTLRTVAFALLGGGLVLGGAGVTLLLLDAGGNASGETGPRAALRCGAGGCVGSVSGRF